MDLGAFFLLLLVLIIVALFVLWPFIKHWRAQVESGHEISYLLAERDRILNAIQELDFDNTLGKIPPEEYPAQRKALLQMGAEVLRQLDTLTSPVSPITKKGSSGNELANRDTESSIGARFSDSAARPAKLLSDDDLEELIAKRRTERKGKAAGFCPKCGKPLLQSDQFCPSCGQAVQSRQA